MSQSVGLFLSLDIRSRCVGLSVLLLVFVAGLSACGHDDQTDCSAEVDDRCPPTYCDVEPVIADKCLRCHSEDGDATVPFFLRTYEEVTAESEAVHRAVRTEFMPATGLDLSPPVQSLSEEEKNLILDWIDGGVATGGCD